MHIILSNATIHARQDNANHHNIWGEGKQDRGKQGSGKNFFGSGWETNITFLPLK